jgi:hypothetical protein
MAIKKYILTIEFDDEGDNCEFIQEEIIDNTPVSKSIIYEGDIGDYYDDSELVALITEDVAKA